jgi:hypothetical protein
MGPLCSSWTSCSCARERLALRSGAHPSLDRGQCRWATVRWRWASCREGARLGQACRAAATPEDRAGPRAGRNRHAAIAPPSCRLRRDRGSAARAPRLARSVGQFRPGCPLRDGAGRAGQSHRYRHSHRFRAADQPRRSASPAARASISTSTARSHFAAARARHMPPCGSAKGARPADGGMPLPGSRVASAFVDRLLSLIIVKARRCQLTKHSCQARGSQGAGEMLLNRKEA